MTNSNKHIAISDSLLIRLQYLCIFIAGLLEFLALPLAHGAIFRIMRFGLTCSFCLFCITAAVQIRKNKTRCPTTLVLALAMVLWFVIVQLLHRANPDEAPRYSLFLSVYLLAFPFAPVTHDENRQIGLKATGLLYVVAALALVFYASLLFAHCVPAFLDNNIYWDGARLFAMLHPNISSRVFMISIAFCLGFSVSASKKHLKALFLVAAAFMFIALSLTNSRAAILLTCLLAAGTAFFGIFKGTWKQFISGVAVGLVVMIALFFTAQWLYQWNSDRLTNTLQTQQPHRLQSLSVSPLSEETEDLVLEEPDHAAVPLSAAPAENTLPASANPQGTLINDLPTLNNRTGIWKAVFQGIRENPSILLFGTANPKAIAAMGGGIHAHNAWLDVLLKLGLPGFIMSLIFTAQAIWSSLCLLFHQQISLWKKIVSMLVLCLLVSAMLEPSLFFTDEMWHAPDFMFFLCLGYTTQWRRQLLKVNRT